jgi:hypothetical protein
MTYLDTYHLKVNNEILYAKNKKKKRFLLEILILKHVYKKSGIFFNLVKLALHRK